MDSGYSLADIRAATDGDNDNGMGGGMMWILILFLLIGGDGFGNKNKGGDCVTPAQLCDSQNFQTLENSVRGIQNGLCDGFYAQNTTMLQGFNTLGMQTMENRFAAEKCCCETNRNIDALRYDAAKNTCDIITAVHADGDATRALITQNTIQQLRDDLQSAQLTLAQASQTRTLIDTIRPCPVPSFPTCNPWATNGCGNSCGCA